MSIHIRVVLLLTFVFTASIWKFISAKYIRLVDSTSFPSYLIYDFNVNFTVGNGQCGSVCLDVVTTFIASDIHYLYVHYQSTNPSRPVGNLQIVLKEGASEQYIGAHCIHCAPGTPYALTPTPSWSPGECGVTSMSLQGVVTTSVTQLCFINCYDCGNSNSFNTYQGQIAIQGLSTNDATGSRLQSSCTLNSTNIREPTSQPSRQPSRQPSSHPTSQPSRQPSSQPSKRPSSQPTGKPSVQPSASPSGQPSNRPTTQPSMQPSQQPSNQPSSQPSVQPSQQPSSRPSFQPTNRPSTQPSDRPSVQPSTVPSTQPTNRPSSQPSQQPSNQPSSQPSMQPSRQPSSRPSTQPSTQPSVQPSTVPSTQPTNRPSMQPSNLPSMQPSSRPSTQPSNRPSVQPSTVPSTQPTTRPSAQPSVQPSQQPSSRPSTQPSTQPSVQPSTVPSTQPTNRPSMQPSNRPSTQPSNRPSVQPSTVPSTQPSNQPSSQPGRQPSNQPSSQPSMQPSQQPGSRPSTQPSTRPSVQPSTVPSTQPSNRPSMQPSNRPSTQPSDRPSVQPSTVPSTQPSNQPSSQPSQQPSDQPSSQPSMQPSQQPGSRPSTQPSTRPSVQPSTVPSTQPTNRPSMQPSNRPSTQPSNRPSVQPSTVPSTQPTSRPSSQPSRQPSDQPSSQPSMQPSQQPGSRPSTQPSTQPSVQPSTVPSTQPTNRPSMQPSNRPSSQPSIHPSQQPSTRPSAQPSVQPSQQPSGAPSFHPSSRPSTQPSNRPSVQPSAVPSTQPTNRPSLQPNNRPSSQPTIRPSSEPSVQPSQQPSNQPSSQPTTQPSQQPSNLTSCRPSHCPTSQPTFRPSGRPFSRPTAQPSSLPSCIPTSYPSFLPSSQPSSFPSIPRSFTSVKGSLFLFGSYSPPPLSSSLSTTGYLESFLEPLLSFSSSYIVFGQKREKFDNYPIIDLEKRDDLSAVFYEEINKDITRGGLIQDSMSRSIALIGDVNKDTYEDLVMCYPYSSVCYVYFGNDIGFVNMIISLSLIGNVESNDGFGWAVVGMGNLNHNADRYCLLISARNSGIVYMVYGSATSIGETVTVSSSSFGAGGVDGFRILQDSSLTSNLGVAIDNAGDFNHDGRIDIIISAFLKSTSESIIYLIYGRTFFASNDLDLRHFSEKDGFKITAPSSYLAGLSLVGLGDINGDHYDDILIGSIPLEEDEYVLQKSYVIYGRKSSPARDITLNHFSKEDGFTIIGGGFMVGSPGDVNGDGINDMMVTSYYDWRRNGNAYLLVYPKNVTCFPTFLPSSSPSYCPTSQPTITPSFVDETPLPSRKPVSFKLPTTSISPFIIPSSINGSTLNRSSSPTSSRSPDSSGTYTPTIQTTDHPSLLHTSHPIHIHSSSIPLSSSSFPSFSPSSSLTSSLVIRKSFKPQIDYLSTAPIFVARTTRKPSFLSSVGPTITNSSFHPYPVNDTSFVDIAINDVGEYTIAPLFARIIIKASGKVTVKYQDVIISPEEKMTKTTTTSKEKGKGGIKIYQILPRINDISLEDFNHSSDVIELLGYKHLHSMQQLPFTLNPYLIFYLSEDFSSLSSSTFSQESNTLQQLRFPSQQHLDVTNERNFLWSSSSSSYYQIDDDKHNTGESPLSKDVDYGLEAAMMAFGFLSFCLFIVPLILSERRRKKGEKEEAEEEADDGDCGESRSRESSFSSSSESFVTFFEGGDQERDIENNSYDNFSNKRKSTSSSSSNITIITDQMLEEEVEKEKDNESVDNTENDIEKALPTMAYQQPVEAVLTLHSLELRNQPHYYSNHNSVASSQKSYSSSADSSESTLSFQKHDISDHDTHENDDGNDDDIEEGEESDIVSGAISIKYLVPEFLKENYEEYGNTFPSSSKQKSLRRPRPAVSSSFVSSSSSSSSLSSPSSSPSPPPLLHRIPLIHQVKKETVGIIIIDDCDNDEVDSDALSDMFSNHDEDEVGGDTLSDMFSNRDEDEDEVDSDTLSNMFSMGSSSLKENDL
jgi:hypothetical protein